MLPDPRLFLRSAPVVAVLLPLLGFGLLAYAQAPAVPPIEPDVALTWLRAAVQEGRWIAACTAGLACVFGLLFWIGGKLHPFFRRGEVRMYLVILAGASASVYESMRTQDVVTWQLVLVASASGLVDWIKKTGVLLNGKKRDDA